MRSDPLTRLMMTACGALAVMLVVGWPSTVVRAADPLLYGPLPLQNPAATQARNQPLADLLGELLGREVRLALFDDHAALIDALARGDIDIAELGPLPFLLARDAAPDLLPIASFREPDGRAEYRCVIVAPVDGLVSLQAVPDLDEDLTLALTRRESTCGPVVSFSVLSERGLDLERVEAAYRGGHDEVAIAVLRQQHLLGGMKDSVASLFHGLGLRVLAASEPVPGFVLALRSGALESASLTHLAQALIELDEAQRGRLQNGSHGFAAFDESLLEAVDDLRSRAMPWLERLED